MIGHMLANENFIDTAIKRESVVSIAKGLGYTPRSHLGSTATVTITVTPPASFVSTTLVLSRGTALTSTKENKTFALSFCCTHSMIILGLFLSHSWNIFR